MSQPELENSPEVRLRDVTEEPQEEGQPHSTRKKKLLMVGGILLLLLVTAVGGYFLLSSKEVNVKAARKTPDRVTSGKDLQQAAYDSLRGSLSNDVSPSAGNALATNIGSEQSPTVAMAGITPSPTPSPGNTSKTQAPVQAGIAMTIAPPPDTKANRTTDTVDDRHARPASPTGSNAVVTSAVTAVASKPKNDASIFFANLPVQTKTEDKSKATPELSTITTKETIPALIDSKLALQKVRTTPSFGAMLPVRLLGVLYTLRVGTLARLELLRESKAEDWHLPRGTVFVGMVQGAGLDRAFVQIKGFIDPITDRFVKLEGETLGSDGGAGLRGKERRLSSVWLRILDRAAQTGTQILTSILGRNNSQVVVATDPYGTYRAASGNEQSQLQGSRSFVEVPAGTVGFVLVTTLPAAQPADSHLAMNVSPGGQEGNEFSDAELAELFASADVNRIRAALPRMNPELRRVTELTLKEMER